MSKRTFRLLLATLGFAMLAPSFSSRAEGKKVPVTHLYPGQIEYAFDEDRNSHGYLCAPAMSDGDFAALSVLNNRRSIRTLRDGQALNVTSIWEGVRYLRCGREPSTTQFSARVRCWSKQEGDWIATYKFFEAPTDLSDIDVDRSFGPFFTAKKSSEEKFSKFCESQGMRLDSIDRIKQASVLENAPAQ